MENEQPKSRKGIYLPIAFAVIFSLGMLLGQRLHLYDNANLPNVLRINQGSKIDEVIEYIKEQYVDTINKGQLEDKSIANILQNLDPHSSYIPAEELKSANEPLQGSFDGIGIEFSIVKDTIRVITALAGGPSEALGILAGDKIVKIEGINAAGVKITNKDVLTKLSGPGNTKVKVGIQRGANSRIIDYTITRGKIPIYSVEAAYMVNKKTGYIKISRFAATTFDEYSEAFEKLSKKGMEQMILDLRGNPGGFLNSAVDFADEFLSDGKEIVYTEGRVHPKKIYTATSTGNFEKQKLIVLIDEGSASASEIIAGAVQDNDRGTIVGRRSFGKGLVQEQAQLSDGSALRLTIARYYTPTGRCIQKSYKEGTDAYYKEEDERYVHGELLNRDSIKVNDSLIYKTPGGKTVYGGGGIIPDVFVPIDTAGRSMYLTEVIYTGVLNQFCFDYADKHRVELNNYKTFESFNSQFTISEHIFNDFIAFAEKNKIKPNAKQINASALILKTQLKANISRLVWHNDGFYPIIHTIDNTLKRAVELMD